MTLRRGYLLVSLVLLAIVAYAAYDSANLSPRSRLFPLSITIPALVLAAVQVVRVLRADPSSDPHTPPEARVSIDALAWALAFFAGVWAIGLLPTMALFAVVYLRLVGKESWIVTAAYAVVLFGATYALFVSVLHVPLPTGVIGTTWGG